MPFTEVRFLFTNTPLPHALRFDGEPEDKNKFG